MEKSNLTSESNRITMLCLEMILVDAYKIIFTQIGSNSVDDKVSAYKFIQKLLLTTISDFQGGGQRPDGE